MPKRGWCFPTLLKNQNFKIKTVFLFNYSNHHELAVPLAMILVMAFLIPFFRFDFYGLS
jgi:hypothetical protein